MRKGNLVCLVLAMACGLAGCGQNKTPEVSSVSISKDGEIAHQIIGSFEQSNYQMDGLSALASERVSEYCNDHGSDSVVLESVEEEESKVLIQFHYASPQDYSEFNHRELFVGSFEEADAQGYHLDGVAFVSSDGKPKEIGDIEEGDTKRVVIVATKSGEDLLVNTYGKVLYINQSATSDLDVTFSGKTGAYISHPIAESESADQSVLSYIVFE